MDAGVRQALSKEGAARGAVAERATQVGPSGARGHRSRRPLGRQLLRRRRGRPEGAGGRSGPHRRVSDLTTRHYHSSLVLYSVCVLWSVCVCTVYSFVCSRLCAVRSTAACRGAAFVGALRRSLRRRRTRGRSRSIGRTRACAPPRASATGPTACTARGPAPSTARTRAASDSPRRAFAGFCPTSSRRVKYCILCTVYFNHLFSILFGYVHSKFEPFPPLP